jgi:hypothetical protein
MKGLIALVIIAILVVVGFSLFGSKSSITKSEKIELAINGLEPLAKGHYEAWLIIGDRKISAGKFNIGDAMTFDVPSDASGAEQFAITIEPEGDTDSVASDIVALSGVFNAGIANLAFSADFVSTNGNYILATPTDGPDTNEMSGVWFLKLPEPPTAGLALPTLPSGWIYEGWVVNNGMPFSTGRFSAVDNADMFSGYSGDMPAPLFPGEDFLLNAPQGVEFPLNLGDGQSLVVISVEPDVNGADPTGDAPFAIKPLVANISADAKAKTNYEMQLNLGSLPTGTATISSIE